MKKWIWTIILAVIAVLGALTWRLENAGGYAFFLAMIFSLVCAQVNDMAEDKYNRTEFHGLSFIVVVICLFLLSVAPEGSLIIVSPFREPVFQGPEDRLTLRVPFIERAVYWDTGELDVHSRPEVVLDESGQSRVVVTTATLDLPDNPQTVIQLFNRFGSLNAYLEAAAVALQPLTNGKYSEVDWELLNNDLKIVGLGFEKSVLFINRERQTPKGFPD